MLNSQDGKAGLGYNYWREMLDALVVNMYSKKSRPMRWGNIGWVGLFLSAMELQFRTFPRGRIMMSVIFTREYIHGQAKMMKDENKWNYEV